VPRISAFYGIDIYIYWADHAPPHFHAIYGANEALIVIADGSVYAGFLPPTARRLVRRWQRLHREELMQAWEHAAASTAPGTIEPLP
jgi:Domain of unknown function (DUF4160)